ncbi:MAG TPA: 50S ribosomal protein L5 [Candidatus Paceibacterota bacterium]
MKSVKELQNNTYENLKKEFGYTNPMQSPRLVKVIISAGIGSLKDKKKIELIKDRLTKIAGQKPAVRAAKKSIASFKSREGDPVGLQVTLRGMRMFGFLDKLINVALPRTKDFRGISKSSVDDMGNITIGLREHTIFPETSDEELRDVFGFAVTITTGAKSKAEATSFLTAIGIPFSKK